MNKLNYKIKELNEYVKQILWFKDRKCLDFYQFENLLNVYYNKNMQRQ